MIPFKSDLKIGAASAENQLKIVANLMQKRTSHLLSHSSIFHMNVIMPKWLAMRKERMPWATRSQPAAAEAQQRGSGNSACGHAFRQHQLGALALPARCAHRMQMCNSSHGVTANMGRIATTTQTTAHHASHDIRCTPCTTHTNTHTHTHTHYMCA